MDEYERILAIREEDARGRCERSNTSLQAQPLARIVENTDGTRRLVPTSKADPTSSEFQRLFGPQGTLTDVLGVGGVSTNGMVMDGVGPLLLTTSSETPTPPAFGAAEGCPTGATGCNPDPYFHFPDLEKDSGDCLYIPTFNDVPVTLSMAVYFAQAFLKEVPGDKILQDIDSELKEVFNKIVEGNLFFNYVPIATIIIVLVWVMVIHGLFDWKAGLLLTFVFIAILWVGYLLLDLTVREDISTVATKTTSTVKDSFSVKNEDIIGNIIKGYYTAVNHMILPEAAICNVGATGACLPIPSAPTGFGGILIPNPASIINGQIAVGGERRCDCINNNDTLIPVIDSLSPCIKDVEGFTLANLTEKQKEEFFKCIFDAVGGNQAVKEAEKCGTPESTLNPGLCALVCGVARCNPTEGEFLAPGCFNGQ